MYRIPHSKWISLFSLFFSLPLLSHRLCRTGRQSSGGLLFESEVKSERKKKKQHSNSKWTKYQSEVDERCRDCHLHNPNIIRYCTQNCRQCLSVHVHVQRFFYNKLIALVAATAVLTVVASCHWDEATAEAALHHTAEIPRSGIAKKIWGKNISFWWGKCGLRLTWMADLERAHTVFEQQQQQQQWDGQ